MSLTKNHIYKSKVLAYWRYMGRISTRSQPPKYIKHWQLELLRMLSRAKSAPKVVYRGIK